MTVDGYDNPNNKTTNTYVAKTTFATRVCSCVLICSSALCTPPKLLAEMLRRDYKEEEEEQRNR
jgi:hypothetical protein